MKAYNLNFNQWARLLLLWGMSYCMLTTSCESDQSPCLPVAVWLVEDLSSTRDGAEKLTIQLAMATADDLAAYPCSTELRVSHFCQNHARPLVLKQLAYQGKLDRYDSDYLKKKADKEQMDSTNIASREEFRKGFEVNFSGFLSSRDKKTDFSYVDRHMRSVAIFLADTSIAMIKLVVISSDFINDEPGSRASKLDKSVIDELNAALALNSNAHLCVITDVPKLESGLDGPNIISLSSWNDVQEILKKLTQSK